MRHESAKPFITSPGGYLLGDTGAGKKTEVLASVIERLAGGLRPRRILVVGCGSGDDAAALARYFGCRVTAIDLDDYFARRNEDLVDFRQMDARNMRFPAASFDFVYSFHALEHIPRPELALAEIWRVLCAGGFYCIGTPNRSRAAGYIGVASCSLRSKIQSNLSDWRQRLLGRFRNECGAHAGFAARELTALCSTIGRGTNISDEYYQRLYAHRGRWISAIIRLRLQAVAWPSVYVYGSKAA
jgi:SAM-dependent methyltransferase